MVLTSWTGHRAYAVSPLLDHQPVSISFALTGWFIYSSPVFHQAMTKMNMQSRVYAPTRHESVIAHQNLINSLVENLLAVPADTASTE